MKNSKRIVIDGQVFAQRKAGMYRFANEIFLELDKIIDYHQVKLIIPKYAEYDGRFKNIEVIRFGNVKGILWTQTSLLVYCIKNNCIALGLTNTTPIFKPGITVVHDVGYKVMKNSYSSLYGKISSLWHRLNYWVIAKSENEIITVSETSEKEIIREYNISPDRITVIGNGWQHFTRITERDDIIRKYPQIKKGTYYFAIGNLEERKNFRWIIEVAKRNKDELFVIAGKAVSNTKDKLNKDISENILFLGFVEDEDVKWLMKNCKAFLFPSIYEGFGIPPLEALSVGARVLCSNVSCLPEICGDAVSYFDPYDYDVDIKELIQRCDKENANYVLGKYSWSKSAREIMKVLF